MKEKVTNSFEKIAEMIANSGGRMYLVGGAVRDKMLKKETHDMDFCVTGLSVEEFASLFPEARVQGKDFPVFIINGCEFALARKERKVGEKHTDFEILADKSITIEEDLSRRDLTVNAMAMDVLTKELIDPFNGAKDIEARVLRMTTNAFCEDPLRVYRVARFAAKLGFEVEVHTKEVMHEMNESLSALSPERVCTEFRKALLTDHPSLFFKVLREAEVLDVYFKEVYDLIGVEQPIEYHPEGDAYQHTMEVLDRAAQMTVGAAYHAACNGASTDRGQNIVDGQRATLPLQRHTLVSDEQTELTRFCALVHDFGKASTPREIWPHHYGHEEAGVSRIKQFCRRLKLPNVFEKAGILTSKYHMMAGRYDSLRPGTKVKMFEAIYASKSLSYEGLEVVAKCDSKDNAIHFAETARQVMDIGATEEMKEKCGYGSGSDGDYQKLKEMILQRRIRKLKEIEK
ncbi:MAG: HD domain-containing protein [Clostridia bacterium]|nr:HD domain-containing protein [Clostridia bacterium]